jgi:hypothetical protein
MVTLGKARRWVAQCVVHMHDAGGLAPRHFDAWVRDTGADVLTVLIGLDELRKMGLLTFKDEGDDEITINVTDECARTAREYLNHFATHK